MSLNTGLSQLPLRNILLEFQDGLRLQYLWLNQERAGYNGMLTIRRILSIKGEIAS